MNDDGAEDDQSVQSTTATRRRSLTLSPPADGEEVAGNGGADPIRKTM
jgi:hypothetical protein